LEDFSHEHLCCWGAAPRGNIAGNLMDETVSDFSYDYMGALMAIIYALNSARAEFLKRQDKRYWWQMIHGHAELRGPVQYLPAPTQPQAGRVAGALQVDRGPAVQ